MNKPSALLDFDGTIVDSADALLEALGDTSQEFGFRLDSEA